MARRSHTFEARRGAAGGRALAFSTIILGVLGVGPPGAAFGSPSTPAQAPTPRVTGLYPREATVEEPVTFALTGTDLPADTLLEIPGCAMSALPAGSYIGPTWTCTPEKAGMFLAVVKDGARGTTLESFTVSFVAALPRVVSLEPLTGKLWTPITFTLSGSHLPPTTVVEVPRCVGTSATNGSAATRTRSCIPAARGVFTATVKDASNGYVLRSFAVTIH